MSLTEEIIEVQYKNSLISLAAEKKSKLFTITNVKVKLPHINQREKGRMNYLEMLRDIVGYFIR